MKAQSNLKKITLERLTGESASLCFSIPTAALLWMLIYADTSTNIYDFVHSYCLYGSIMIFGVIALIYPKIFPSILGLICFLISKLGSLLTGLGGPGGLYVHKNTQPKYRS